MCQRVQTGAVKCAATWGGGYAWVAVRQDRGAIGSKYQPFAAAGMRSSVPPGSANVAIWGVFFRWGLRLCGTDPVWVGGEGRGQRISVSVLNDLSVRLCRTSYPHRGWDGAVSCSSDATECKMALSSLVFLTLPPGWTLSPPFLTTNRAANGLERRHRSRPAAQTSSPCSLIHVRRIPTCRPPPGAAGIKEPPPPCLTWVNLSVSFLAGGDKKSCLLFATNSSVVVRCNSCRKDPVDACC